MSSTMVHNGPSVVIAAASLNGTRVLPDEASACRLCPGPPLMV
jgi:hypothetical protein